MASAISRQIGLGCTRKAADHEPRCQPESIGPLWFLFQLIWVSALTSLVMDCTKEDVIISLFPQIIFSQSFIIATESKLEAIFNMKRHTIVIVSLPVIVTVCEYYTYSVIDLLPLPQEMTYSVRNNKCDHMVFYTQSSIREWNFSYSSGFWGKTFPHPPSLSPVTVVVDAAYWRGMSVAWNSEMTKRLLKFDGLLQTQHTCLQLSPTAPCHRKAARNTEQLFLIIMRNSIVDDIGRCSHSRKRARGKLGDLQIHFTEQTCGRVIRSLGIQAGTLNCSHERSLPCQLIFNF